MLDITKENPASTLDSAVGTEPLTVLCTLLSRADNTPLNQRRKGPLQMLDLYGEVLGDPANTVNAFEAQPNLNFEKWTEYWRKTHGPRFTHALPTQADGRHPLLRYDQIHRLSAGPSHLSPLPYLPPLDNDGRLFDSVIGRVPPYARPDWDGIAYLGFANTDALQVTFGHEEISRAILPEDQVIFRELCPILCRQHILIPSATSRESILLISLIRRNRALSRDQFQRRWLQEYAPRLLEQPATQRLVRRYVQLHNIGPVDADQPLYHEVAKDIDGVAISAFSSIIDLEEFLLDPGIAALTQAQAPLIDTQQPEYWTGLAFQVINQLPGETHTASPAPARRDVGAHA
ncbi:MULTISPECIES: EthD domain-containing protein [unclassified Pseudomonas]|uniref:EthD domain-containing protein n=1 Tax=unclassified Pseudomonas TaxID=196821 RepID=UPI0021C64A30|nr:MULTISPECIES: EthD domain-containing protein [unclassified Pseudomonas]MCU1733761.1 EthD domain-containing protein [Pseudomonas sp. 20P_3.2_Bac4]MCU1742561.1 EthD domain-containing protein [Pseudomonas sp. 20P_3.2_Bac5]